MKRRILVVLLVCCMLLGLIPGGVVTVAYEGGETQLALATVPNSSPVSADVVRIRTAQELAVIRPLA